MSHFRIIIAVSAAALVSACEAEPAPLVAELGRVGQALQADPARGIGSSAQRGEHRRAAEARTLTVMSFNIWGGGANAGKPVDETVAAIRAAGADIVGIQETRLESDPCTAEICPAVGPSAAPAIAEALGFYHYDQKQENAALWANAVLSRYPITGATRHDLGVTIDIGGRTLAAFNIHLTDFPYQPYQLLGIEYGAAPFLDTAEAAVAAAEAARGAGLELLFEDLAEVHGADASFVFGDFNEPSHRDWTAGAVEAGLQPLVVPYPTARAIERRGFTDALRAVFPDPVTKPAFTWTPTTAPTDPEDHHDRIDYVFVRGAGVVIDHAAIVGEKAPEADVVVSPWPSDHRAVTATLHFGAAPEGCANHEDEEAPGERERASRPVTWHHPQRSRPSGIVKARLLGINDFHGRLSEGLQVSGRPVGGAAVLASYLKAASLGFEGRSLIVHAGDQVGASPPESALLQDEPAIEFLNALANRHCRGALRLDERCNIVGTAGNHEFDEGAQELLRLVYGGNHANGPFLEDPYAGARFPYVSANVVHADGGSPLLPPYVIVRVGAVRVGVIGAVLKETPSIVTPSGVAGLDFLDEATAINQQVAVLERKGVQAIVVSIHQGGLQTPSNGGPTEPDASVGAPISSIVGALDDAVDVVISGHTHGFTNALVKNQNGIEILVTQAFSNGTAYGEIDLDLDGASGDVVAKSARIVSTYSDQAPGNVRDPAVQVIVDEARASVAPRVNQVVAQTAADITRAANAAGESSLGDLIADAQRAALGTDFAFMNPGGIRADLSFAADATNPADADGSVLWGELFTIAPFGNSLVRMQLTGAQIVALLEQQWLGQPSPRMLQISGLTYTWDASLPDGQKIVEVRKDGVPLDTDASYSVAVNNFLAAGGDNFTVLTTGTAQVGGPIDLDALIDYAATALEPLARPPLARITRVN